MIVIFRFFQHAELTPDFKQYLEDQGLSKVFVLQKLSPAILVILGKSCDCYFDNNYDNNSILCFTVVIAAVCLLAAILVVVALVKSAVSKDTHSEKIPLVKTDL